MAVLHSSGLGILKDVCQTFFLLFSCFCLEGVLNSGNILRVSAAWWAILALTIVFLGVYAINSGGRISVEPSRVEINASSGVSPNGARGIDNNQRASAGGEDALAVNSLGNIGFGASTVNPSGVQASRSTTSQDAKANGKKSRAVNAIGDINIK
ncbi:hypothetical protein KPA96_19150 [Burkholderia cenocepacia]|uniref:hypothetical protein n=1 Tax=Burkholderia cenocepacia TaxID=95486 RepID=UPI002862981C|nr:hypothetical protein [Burkholderia cenocepacia]MDR8077775.1 hypothetical protein [Burkholderia cenocepacia]